MCDGQTDCAGEEDELGCPGWCPRDETAATRLCADGRRYPLRYACSGLVGACQGLCETCDPEVPSSLFPRRESRVSIMVSRLPSLATSRKTAPNASTDPWSHLPQTILPMHS